MPAPAVNLMPAVHPNRQYLVFSIQVLLAGVYINFRNGLVGEVNHSTSHCNLAKFRVLMIMGKYGDVIGQ